MRVIDGEAAGAGHRITLGRRGGECGVQIIVIWVVGVHERIHGIIRVVDDGPCHRGSEAAGAVDVTGIVRHDRRVEARGIDIGDSSGEDESLPGRNAQRISSGCQLSSKCLAKKGGGVAAPVD